MTAEQQQQVGQGIAQIHEISKQIRAIFSESMDGGNFICYTAFNFEDSGITHEMSTYADRPFIELCRFEGFAIKK